MKKLGLLFAVATLAACAKTGSPSKSNALVNPAATTNSAGVVSPTSSSATGSSDGSMPPPPSNTKTSSDDKIVSSDVVVASVPVNEPLEQPTPGTAKIGGTTKTFVSPETTKSERPHSPASQCSEPYRETREEWSPGLPQPPAAQPVFTDLVETPGALRFTDARQDGLFNVAVDRANALPKEVLRANQDFAKQIRDVKVSLDLNRTHEVKVRVVYMHHMARTTLELRGVIEKSANTTLAQVPVAGAPKDTQTFAGVLTCTDLEKGCKNILLRLDLKGKVGKVARTAFIVHRWSKAHVTMSESERTRFASIPNQNQSLFAENFSNTLNNSCLNILSEVKGGKLNLPECAVERLRATCGSEDAKKPAARAFGLRSWAVAYGRSGFEFIATHSHTYDGVADLDVKRTPYIAVSGPLVYGKSTPVYPHPLLVTGAVKGLNEVLLMNNDGGGNLNLQFDFAGQSNARSRVSVSSLLPSENYAQAVVNSAKTMPNLSQQDIEPLETPVVEN